MVGIFDDNIRLMIYLATDQKCKGLTMPLTLDTTYRHLPVNYMSSNESVRERRQFLVYLPISLTSIYMVYTVMNVFLIMYVLWIRQVIQLCDVHSM
jgi:hypothetical protein